MTDIKEPVTQVALGKAHILALTNKGHVYTFGINHKGQCGREFIHGPNRDGIFYFHSLNNLFIKLFRMYHWDLIKCYLSALCSLFSIF